MKSDCVFCNRANLKNRLIAENKNWYVVATFGQITDGGYVLLIPKKHVLCIGALEVLEIQEMMVEVNKLDDYLYREYRFYPTLFEHGIVGQSIKHAHLHFLPANLYLTERIRTDFPGKATDIVPSLSWIRSMYLYNLEPYLFWRDSNREFTICWNPPAPPQYLRLITAELLGRPERGNWRNMDSELDKRLGQETIRRLKPYFK